MFPLQSVQFLDEMRAKCCEYLPLLLIVIMHSSLKPCRMSAHANAGHASFLVQIAGLDGAHFQQLEHRCCTTLMARGTSITAVQSKESKAKEANQPPYLQLPQNSLNSWQ
jgi:hypothetical protein